jgi:hypothetical protein
MCACAPCAHKLRLLHPGGAPSPRVFTPVVVSVDLERRVVACRTKVYRASSFPRHPRPQQQDSLWEGEPDWASPPAPVPPPAERFCILFVGASNSDEAKLSLELCKANCADIRSGPGRRGGMFAARCLSGIIAGIPGAQWQRGRRERAGPIPVPLAAATSARQASPGGWHPCGHNC